MIKTVLFTMILLPALSQAAGLPGSECAAPGNYVEGMLLANIKNDLGIDLTTIRYDKTTVEILSISPVSELFARKLAIADSQADLKRPADIRLTEKDYYSIYHDNHVLTVTAKYTFTDKSNKRDVFISSSFVNDNECSVRYNGYLTLSRDF